MGNVGKSCVSGHTWLLTRGFSIFSMWEGRTIVSAYKLSFSLYLVYMHSLGEKREGQARNCNRELVSVYNEPSLFKPLIFY